MLQANQRWAMLLAVAALAACGGQETDGAAATDAGPAAITPNQTGTNGGYFYSCWSSGQGSVNMTLDGSNGYSVTWSNVGDFTCGKGWNPGSSHTISYTGSYTNSGGGAYGIYGWTTNPLVEYYIVEKTGSTGGPGQGTQVGTVSSDGGTYTIWKHQQVNQPCITGNACTFWQYISVRQSQRTGGTITIQNHFAAWAQKGMNLGAHNYQILLTEGWNGSGNASARISEGGSTSSGGTSSGGTSSGGTSSGGTSSGGTSSGGTSGGGGGACTATFSARAWNGGFTGTVNVKAGASPIDGWTVTLDLHGATVTQVWSATGSGGTFRNASYNGALPAGGSTTFGFNGAFSGSFQAPTVVRCTSP